MYGDSHNDLDDFREFEQSFGFQQHIPFIFTEAQDMFRHFEEIFGNMGLTEFPPLQHSEC